MKTSIYYQSPAISHEVCYPGEDLIVTWRELQEAEVGKQWSIEDQDQFPNRTRTWLTTYTVVYKDKTGTLVKRDEDGVIELMWFSFNN